MLWASRRRLNIRRLLSSPHDRKAAYKVCLALPTLLDTNIMQFMFQITSYQVP